MGQRAEAYIVDAIRTPTGKRRGSLATVHGADLGGFILKALVERHDIPDHEYEDVVFGCLDTIGPLAGDIARTCWLAAGLSDVVPGTTVDRQCGSSQQAVHFAAQAVMSGTMDVVVAGGVQTMCPFPSPRQCMRASLTVLITRSPVARVGLLATERRRSRSLSQRR